jgi:hypothetical protein
MKTILVCLAALFGVGAVACGKSAAELLCEKKNACEGTTTSCARPTVKATTKCDAENDAHDNCVLTKGTCENKVYSAGVTCNPEAAAIAACLLGVSTVVPEEDSE